MIQTTNHYQRSLIRYCLQRHSIPILAYSATKKTCRAYGALAVEQLNDPDQQIRLVGLNYLKPASADVGVPFAAALLDDPTSTCSE